MLRMRTSLQGIFRAVALMTLLAVEHSGSGQVFSCAETIDGLVAQSDVVLIGEIVGLTGQGGNDVYGHDWKTVDLHVSEVLRGNPATNLKANLSRQIGTYSRGIPLAELQRWQHDREHLLVLIESDKNGSRWPALGTVIDLADTSITMWTPDFRQVRGGFQILSLAQEEAKRLALHGPADVVCIDKSKRDFSGTNLADIMARGLMVPADERLDERARAIITGVELTPYGEDSRNLAIEALGHSPTTANRALLLQILHGNDSRLRWAAYEGLKRMGVDVMPPTN